VTWFARVVARVPSLEAAVTRSLVGAAIGGGAYIAFRAINYDSNGVRIAREIDLGRMPWANHLLFEASGYVATQVASLVGQTGPSFSLLLILSALFGGVALGATNLAARRTGSGRLEAIAATVWL